MTLGDSEIAFDAEEIILSSVDKLRIELAEVKAELEKANKFTKDVLEIKEINSKATLEPSDVKLTLLNSQLRNQDYPLIFIPGAQKVIADLEAELKEMTEDERLQAQAHRQELTAHDVTKEQLAQEQVRKVYVYSLLNEIYRMLAAGNDIDDAAIDAALKSKNDQDT